MSHAPALFAPERLLAAPWSDAPVPAAVVALAADWPTGAVPCLPPFPVIGIGRGDEPLARAVDVIVPDAAEAALLADNCARQPAAARVLVELLRLIEDLPLPAALTAESLAYGLLQASEAHRRWIAQRPPAHAPAAGRSDPVVVEREAGWLAIHMDRPETLNAVDRAMRDALREAFDIGALDPEITRITLSGRGRAFSVGADLTEFGTTTDPVTAHAIRSATLPAHALAACGSKLEARIHGACVGSGLEMAAFAQSLVATPDAWFQLPELAMGLIPGAGGCVSLSRRMGRQGAARLVLSGRRISARVALDRGLIDRIVTDNA